MYLQVLKQKNPYFMEIKKSSYIGWSITFHAQQAANLPQLSRHMYVLYLNCKILNDFKIIAAYFCAIRKINNTD